MDTAITILPHPYSFCYSTCTGVIQEMTPALTNEEHEKEKKMNYERNNPETSKRNSMESFLYSLGDVVETKLSEKFGLRDLPYPKTVEEYESRLKAGEYVIEKDRYTESPRLRWRLPSTVEDKDGFTKAWLKFCNARDKVMLKVAVADLQEALKAVEDLRDTDISVYYS